MKITDEAVEAFTQYRRSQVAELRPWQSGDDMSGVSVSAEDAKAGSPKSGDMIARNPKNHADQWLVAAAYFADNFEPLAALPHLSQGAVRVKPLEWKIASGRHEHSHSIFGDHFAYDDGSWTSPENHHMRSGGSLESAKAEAQADYERRILSALSPAPVGVTDEMVLKFITMSRDEDAGYQNWTEAVTAGLNATLASHEPAPTDTQEGLSEAMKARVIAWQGYFPGAGSINSETNLTKSEYRAKQWKEDGATVTALVTLASLTACQQEVERLRDLLDRTIPETMEYDAESGGFYDTELTHDIRAVLGGQSNG